MIIIDYWQQITKEAIIQLDVNKKPEDHFRELLANNPQLDADKALKCFGMLNLIDSVGSLGFDVLLSDIASDRTIQRYRKCIRELKIAEGSQHFVLRYITCQLEEFEAISSESVMKKEK